MNCTSRINMRPLLISVCVILLTLPVIQSRFDSIYYTKDISSTFFKNSTNTNKLLELMKTNFDLSLSYLFTSKQYGSQYAERPGMAKFLLEASDKSKLVFMSSSNLLVLVEFLKTNFDLSLSYLFTSKQYGSQYAERPGMAKFLLEASDKHWEEGLDVLKKFLQRGGTLNDVKFQNITGKGEVKLSQTDVTGDIYVKTLNTVLDGCLKLYAHMNALWHRASKAPVHSGDAEIAHYLEEKLENEAKRIREVSSHAVTLEKMKSLGVALNMFDSNL